MKAGLFHSGGYTETGGLQDFLRKLRSDVEWQRCFPVKDKPGPKLRLDADAPHADHAGTTGARLVKEMIKCLQQFYAGENCPFDFVLLVDDADCRFSDSPAAFPDWRAELTARVREAVGRDLPVYILLASPEIESWLLADWEMGFGGHDGYRDIQVALRRHLGDCLLAGASLDWQTVEDFGGQRIGGSCEHKLSEALRDAVRNAGRCKRCVLSPVPATSSAGAPSRLLDYSKRYDGAPMLKRIRPEHVRARCQRYFAPSYVELLAAAPDAG